MQNVQNAAEIQQRVINLIELYRTKVGKESKIAKDAKSEKDYWDKANLNAAIKLHEDGMKDPIGIDLSPDMPEEWVKTLRVNDHLLGHFYSVIAGNNADKDVLSQFLADYYDTSVFTTDEEEFLRSHFKEMVNYIIQTPCDDLDSVKHHDGKDWHLIPDEVLQLIKNRVKIPAGTVIYNPFSGFAQIPLLFHDCKCFCEESYSTYNKRWNEFSEKCHKESNIVLGMRDVNQMTAWMKVALYANSIDSNVIEDDMIPTKYDSVVSFIPRIPDAIPGQAYELDFEIPSDPDTINKLITSYDNLPSGGKYVLILPKVNLWASNSYYSLRPLWEKMIKDNSLAEIIQMPSIMSINHHHDDFCMVIAEKGRKEYTTTLIDARFATIKSDHKNFDEILDLSSLEDMFANGGKECTTGLRKMVQVSTKDLNVEILIPQVYVVDKPLYEENPLPLATFGTLATTRIRSLQIDLPEDTPWVELSDLSHSFKGELDITTLKKAGCPNNPKYEEGSEDYAFSKSGKFIDDYWAQTDSKKGGRVYDYRRCTYLDGSKDAVLFRSSQSGIGAAIIRGTKKPIAIGLGIKAFVLKDGIDALTLIAILRLPVVHRQMQAYTEFGLADHLDDILVPSDKRIIYDEIQRMLKENDVVGNLENNLSNIKRSVRMRKHALTQSLSSLEAMFYALNAYRERKEGHIADEDIISRVKGTTVKDAFEYLSKGLKGMMPVLEHIAEVEYTFAKKEWIDPELFIEDYIARMEKGWLNFKPVITWAKGNNQAKDDVYAFTNTQPSQKELVIKKGQSIRQFLFPKDALEHILKNIISNAQSWAFNDKSREDYQLRFSWHIGGKGKTLIIEIENNGTPIPEDRDTTSLLEYGVSTALHHDGHNGIGCNEIDDIMQSYDGKVEIVSTPQSIFTVKYVLTFNHIDDMGSKYKVIKPVDF